MTDVSATFFAMTSHQLPSPISVTFGREYLYVFIKTPEDK